MSFVRVYIYYIYYIYICIICGWIAGPEDMTVVTEIVSLWPLEVVSVVSSGNIRVE